MVADTDSPTSFEAQLPAELGSVVAARRILTAATQSWGISEEVGEDAALAVSELVTNAVLHAGTPFALELRQLGSGIRVEVRDGSSHLPVVDAARPEDLLANRSMTGRGLALVAAVSDRWGADPSLEGKVTWAEIGTGRRLVASAAPPAFPPQPTPPIITESDRLAGVTATSAMTGGGRHVHLIGVPVQLLIDSSRQLVDLQREIQVMALDHSGPAELERVFDSGRPIVTELDHWAEADRRLVDEAVAQGHDRLDCDFTVPPDIAERIEGFVLWFRRAASTIIRRHLLSLPPTAEVVAYRKWCRDEILAQLAGRQPRPCPLEIPDPR